MSLGETSMPCWAYVLKPAEGVMVKSYLAGSKLLNRKIPSGPLVVARANPVVRFFSSTRAPGTAALVESVTVPSRLPVDVWANTQAHRSAASENAAIIRFRVISRPPTLCELPAFPEPGSMGYDGDR